MSCVIISISYIKFCVIPCNRSLTYDSHEFSTKRNCSVPKWGIITEIISMLSLTVRTDIPHKILIDSMQQKPRYDYQKNFWENRIATPLIKVCTHILYQCFFLKHCVDKKCIFRNYTMYLSKIFLRNFILYKPRYGYQKNFGKNRIAALPSEVWAQKLYHRVF